MLRTNFSHSYVVVFVTYYCLLHLLHVLLSHIKMNEWNKIKMNEWNKIKLNAFKYCFTYYHPIFTYYHPIFTYYFFVLCNIYYHHQKKNERKLSLVWILFLFLLFFAHLSLYRRKVDSNLWLILILFLFFCGCIASLTTYNQPWIEKEEALLHECLIPLRRSKIYEAQKIPLSRVMHRRYTDRAFLWVVIFLHRLK